MVPVEMAWDKKCQAGLAIVPLNAKVFASLTGWRLTAEGCLESLGLEGLRLQA